MRLGDDQPVKAKVSMSASATRSPYSACSSTSLVSDAVHKPVSRSASDGTKMSRRRRDRFMTLRIAGLLAVLLAIMNPAVADWGSSDIVGSDVAVESRVAAVSRTFNTLDVWWISADGAVMGASW